MLGLYWGYIRMMEKMETTIRGLRFGVQGLKVRGLGFEGLQENDLGFGLTPWAIGGATVTFLAWN